MPTPNSPTQSEPEPAKPSFFSNEKLPTSPAAPTEQWRGVMIKAPERAAINLSKPAILLTGLYRIQGNDYPKEDRLKIVVTDVASKKEYAAFLGQSDANPNVPPPPRNPPNPDAIKKMVFTGYFNSDFRTALGLPSANATYRVRVFLGNIQSNEVTVQVVVE